VLEPEPEPEAELELKPTAELELEPAPERAPEPELEPEPEHEFELLPEPEPTLEPETGLEPEPPRAPEPAPVFEPAPVDVEEAAPQFWDMQDFTETPEESIPPAAGDEAGAISPPAVDEFSLDDFSEESAVFGGGGAEPPPAPALPVAPAPTAETAAQAGAGAGEFEEFLAEADFYFQQGLVDEAEFLYSKLLRLAPGHPGVTAQLRKLEEMRAPTPAGPTAADFVNLDEALDVAFGGEALEPSGAPPPPAPAGGGDFDAEASGFSDFLAGLGQELGAEIIPPPPESFASQKEEGLTEIFQEFQRSVKEQLGDEDYETHYNLGIAYKEMGLMDEAITELALAEKSPVRRLDAVSMIALCLREMGRFDEAAQRLRNGISLAVEGSEDQKGFLYDLAMLHEQAGRATEAQEALRRLMDIDPGYRDVAARVGAAPPPANTPPRKKPKVSYL
jgi:tetratricopeptide (TPR) repeat protein